MCGWIKISVREAGDGICAEICPSLFVMAPDGLAYTKEVNDPTGLDPVTKEPKYQMGHGLAFVPDDLLDDAIESAEECPGECIFFTQIGQNGEEI